MLINRGFESPYLFLSPMKSKLFLLLSAFLFFFLSVIASYVFLPHLWFHRKVITHEKDDYLCMFIKDRYPYQFYYSQFYTMAQKSKGNTAHLINDLENHNNQNLKDVNLQRLYVSLFYFC
jgi:hypothetical protein